MLVDSSPDDLAQIASSNQGAYSASVLLRTYDVYYQGPSPGVHITTASLREIPNAKIASQVKVAASGTTTLNIDVPVATVKGSVTVNGASLGATSSVYGQLFLVGPQRGSALLGATNQGKRLLGARRSGHLRPLLQIGATACSPSPAAIRN